MKQMEPIRSFSQLTERLAQLPRRVRVAVAGEADRSTAEAVCQAVESGFAQAVFVGKRPEGGVRAMLDSVAEHVEYVAAEGEDCAAQKAVELVRQGRADILMKGLLHTDNLLRAVLNKEHGLLPAGQVLSHITVAEVPDFDRLLFYTDVAVIPQPTEEQRIWQVRYADRLCRAFGIAPPRIALVHFTEKVSPKFPLTSEYRALAEASRRGEWGTTIIDGPLDVRTAVDPGALAVKGIASPLEGRADVLVLPDLEAGNAVYKTLTFFARARQAGLLVGTSHPVVLTSRGDENYTKFLSIATAAIAATNIVS